MALTAASVTVISAGATAAGAALISMAAGAAGTAAKMEVIAAGAAALAAPLTVLAVSAAAAGAAAALAAAGFTAMALAMAAGSVSAGLAVAGVALLAASVTALSAAGSAVAVVLTAAAAGMTVMATVAAVAAAGITAMMIPMAEGAATVGIMDAALLALDVTTAASAAAMVLLEAQLLAVMASMASIAADAQTAGSAIRGMTAGMDIVQTALGSLQAEAQQAVEQITDAFKSAAPGVWDAAKQVGMQITNPIRTATQTTASLFRSMATSAQQSAQTIRSAFSNMRITIPAPKLPHITVTYQTTGTGGAKTTIPKFTTQYFANGGILDQPTMIGMNGARPMVAGEKGPEAVTPLSELWKQMGNMADRMRQGPQGSVTYSPQIIIQGNASRSDITAANRQGMEDFRRMYQQMQAEDRRRRL